MSHTPHQCPLDERTRSELPLLAYNTEAVISDDASDLTELSRISDLHDSEFAGVKRNGPAPTGPASTERCDQHKLRRVFRALRSLRMSLPNLLRSWVKVDLHTQGRASLSHRRSVLRDVLKEDIFASICHPGPSTMLVL